jgi:ABC-type branched-subunit amino acid transport system substrate-binding protein
MSRGGTEHMKRRIGWPPGVGWLPLGVALTAVLLMSTFSLLPQFGTRILGSTGGGQAAVGPGATASDPNGTGTTSTGTSTRTGPKAPGGKGTVSCAPGKNGGATDIGVTATEIHIATTTVTSGIAKDFLGEAVDGIISAVNQANNAGGVCGRRLVLDPGAGDVVNTGWDPAAGNNAISNFVHSHKYFALVGEPDSEGLAGAIDGHTIDQLPGEAPIPVVGTDGMLRDQYHNDWVWPVAASTVTNMHIAVKYAHDVLGARTFGIVYDTHYKFGSEGAGAYAAEVARVGGTMTRSGDTCSGTQACGFDATTTTDYPSLVTPFNGACSGKCDVVMMLLEPGPMLNWMKTEGDDTAWYKKLMGGEPLFDHRVGEQCQSCNGLLVWTGFRPPSGSFSAEQPVYTYAQSLPSKDDSNNPFTEGAYLGTQMFVQAVKRLAADGYPLTRQNLRTELNTDTYNFGLSIPLTYNNRMPHLANLAMAGFADNRSGTFHGWDYQNTGFLADPAPGAEQ